MCGIIFEEIWLGIYTLFKDLMFFIQADGTDGCNKIDVALRTPEMHLLLSWSKQAALYFLPDSEELAGMVKLIMMIRVIIKRFE